MSMQCKSLFDKLQKKINNIKNKVKQSDTDLRLWDTVYTREIPSFLMSAF